MAAMDGAVERELELVEEPEAIDGEVVEPLPAALMPVTGEMLTSAPLVLPSDQHPALVYLARLTSPHSRRTMTTALTIIARLLSGGQCNLHSLAWAALRYQHTAAVRAALAERYAPASANLMLSALRGVLKEAWLLGQLTAEEYQRAANLKTVGGETLPRGRALAPGELRALFRVCAEDRRPAGARDAALLAALYGGGLRRSEVVALLLADYDPTHAALTVRHGKGNKARIVYLTDGSARALAAWLRVRGSAPGPLFLPINKGDKLGARPLHANAVLKILRKRGAQAGVELFSPHDLRRSFISDLLDAGADIATVQKLAGHANVTTTTRYDRRGEAAKKRAAGLLHVPFARTD